MPGAAIKTKSSKFYPALFYSLLYFLLLLPLISIFDVGGSSEAREIHVAKIMYQTGEWILPLRDGLLPSKPPLFHWLTAATGFFTGGVEPFNARLISLMAAAATVFLAVFIALSFSSGENKGKAAYLSALILCTSYGFMRLTADSRVDMLFCFFANLAVSFIVWPFSPSNQRYSAESYLQRPVHFIGFYLACVFAVLAKGPLGFVLPAIISFSITSWYYGLKRSLHLWFLNKAGIFIFLLLAPVWYFLAYQRAGYDFISKQILFENLSRFTGSDVYHTEPFWFYITSFLSNAFPWSVAFIFYLFSAGRKYLKTSKIDPQPKSYEGLFITWFLSGIIFFSLAFGKRHSYITPLFISVAVYLALKFLKASFSLEWRERIRDLVLLLMCIAALLIVLLPVILQPEDLSYWASKAWILENQRLLLLYCVAPIGLKALFAVFNLDSYWKRDLLLLISLQALLAFSLCFGLGIKNNLKGFKKAASDINLHVSQDKIISAVREKNEELLDPVLFYLNRNVPIVTPDLALFLCGQYYLFQYKYLDKYLASNQSLKVKAVYYEVPDVKEQNKESAIVLSYFDCSAS